MEFLGLIFALVAIFMTRTMRKQLDAIAFRLDAGERAQADLRREVAGLRGGPAPEVKPDAPEALAEPQAEIDQPADETAGVTSEPIEESAVPTITPSEEIAGAAGPRTSLEERLGTRWAVWVGGLALGLGGLLLVRYSIEQGFFGPGARIVMGALFAAALIAAGEWFRRTERALPIDTIPSAHIPSVLTAAGTVAAFGTIYAAHALYEFIGPALTFILLGVVGIGTMLAAALHGPALAGLGLAGAYVAPMLVSSDKPNPWPVVIYLAVVAASAYGLARLRRWLWLAGLAVAGAVLWSFPFLSQMVPGDGDWTLAGYSHLLIQLVLAAVFIGIEPNAGVRDEDAEPDLVSSVALGALAVMAAAMLLQSRYGLGALVPFVFAVVALLSATAWMSAPAAAAAPWAGLVALAAVIAWPGLSEPPAVTLLAPAVAGVLRLPENVSSYMLFGAVISLGVAAIAGYRLWLGRVLNVRAAGLYTLAATVTLLLALVLVYLRVTQFDQSIPFAFAGAALGGLFVLAAERFLAREREIPSPAAMLATGAFAAAAIGALCFALVATLSRGYLTVAFALAALGTAWVATLRDIPLLRYAVTAIGLVVLGRIAWDPVIMGADVGRTPIFNWLLLGYGVPAVAFASAAVLLRTRAQDLAVRLSESLAILFAALLFYFQIRHALNDGDPLKPASGHVEMGLFALTSLGFSFVLTRLDVARTNPVFRIASLIFGVISAFVIAGGLLLAENPFLTHSAVSGPTVFSSLMLAYLLPGLMAALIARHARGVRPQWYVMGATILAGLLLFAYVTLEVRHAFRGERIGFMRSTSSAEVWTYSAAWLVLGLVFLAYSIWRGSREARMASAALVLLSVAKVFLLDLSGLTGLWRALSFISLGVVLIGIGLAYQKLVFAKPAASPPTSE
ncbi:MAG: DUF2339 domain-containing protein [Hyphomicrobiaceae bacterium]